MSRHHTARGMAVYLRAWRSRVVLEGFIGTGLITAGSLTPAYLPLNSPWWSRLGRMGLVGPTWRVVGTALALLGVGLLIDSWLRLRPGRQWERPRGIRAGMHPWAVLGVWGLPLLLAPPIFSHDAYSYAAQGWLLVNGISPYDGYPGLLPGAFADQVAQEWRYTRTPYGPLSLQIQHLIVHLTGDNPYWSAVLMRVPALLGVILIGLLLPRLARRTGHDPYFAAWFASLNPLLVIDFIGGAHNDSLMMGLLVLGLWVATLAGWAWLPAALVVGVAAAIKQPAVMGALALPVIRRTMRGWAPREVGVTLGRVVVSLLLAAASFSLLSWVTGLGFGWYHAVDVPGMVMTVSPSTLVGLAIRWVLNLLGAHAAAAQVISVTHTVGMVLGFLGLAVLAVRYLPTRPLAFLAWGYLAFTLASPALHSWYVLWGAILLPLVDRAVRFVRTAVWATVVLLAYDAVNLSWRNGVLAVGVAAVVLLAAHLVWHERSTGQGWSFRGRLRVRRRHRPAGPGHGGAPGPSGDVAQ